MSECSASNAPPAPAVVSVAGVSAGLEALGSSGHPFGTWGALGYSQRDNPWLRRATPAFGIFGVGGLASAGALACALWLSEPSGLRFLLLVANLLNGFRIVDSSNPGADERCLCDHQDAV